MKKTALLALVGIAPLIFAPAQTAENGQKAQSSATFVGQAYAYPVPFIPSQGQTKITFTNLALQTTIRIYDVSGQLVRELQETDGDGQLDWDGKNARGEEAESGVYLYQIKSGADEKMGKLVIIR